MGMVISGVRMRFWGVGPSVKGRGDNPDRREYMKAMRWDETPKAGKDLDFITNYQPYMHARNNVIEYNEVFNCMQRLADGNCIYLSATGDGNVVRRNLVHSHVKGNMIRTDDDQFGALVTENIFVGNASTKGYALKRINSFEHNILIQCDTGGQRAGGGPEAGSRIRRNIFYHLDETPRRYVWTRILAPLRPDEIDYNLYWTASDEGAAAKFLAGIQKEGWDANSLAAAPLFVDVQALDFTLKPESPAFKLGFRPFEGMETIGLLNEPALPRLRDAGGLDALMAVEVHSSKVFE